ncbi:MAG: hypothetical protein EPO06_05710 [Burkholderiaceae bacterium]|nr:MAG: hypothetical protein EPO06_05710 [Burkholderiaceae bacterium]
MPKILHSGYSGTEAQRRIAHEQALANTRIEGHIPSAEFLVDCEAVIAGTMTREQARERSLRRALEMECALSGSKRNTV